MPAGITGSWQTPSVLTALWESIQAPARSGRRRGHRSWRSFGPSRLLWSDVGADGESRTHNRRFTTSPRACSGTRIRAQNLPLTVRESSTGAATRLHPGLHARGNHGRDRNPQSLGTQERPALDLHHVINASRAAASRSSSTFSFSNQARSIAVGSYQTRCAVSILGPWCASTASCAARHASASRCCSS